MALLSLASSFSTLDTWLTGASGFVNQVNNIYERVHKIQNEIADPLGDIVPGERPPLIKALGFSFLLSMNLKMPAALVCECSSLGVRCGFSS